MLCSPYELLLLHYIVSITVVADQRSDVRQGLLGTREHMGLGRGFKSRIHALVIEAAKDTGCQKRLQCILIFF